MKPNYREAYLTLGVLYSDLGKKEQAKKQFDRVLQLIPNDPEAIEHLEKLK